MFGEGQDPPSSFPPFNLRPSAHLGAFSSCSPEHTIALRDLYVEVFDATELIPSYAVHSGMGVDDWDEELCISMFKNLYERALAPWCDGSCTPRGLCYDDCVAMNDACGDLFVGRSFVENLMPDTLSISSTTQFRMIIEGAVPASMLACFDEVLKKVIKEACGTFPQYQPTGATAYFQEHDMSAMPELPFTPYEYVSAGGDTDVGARNDVPAAYFEENKHLADSSTCVPFGVTNAEWVEMAGDGPCAKKKWDDYDNTLLQVTVFNDKELAKLQDAADAVYASSTEGIRAEAERLFEEEEQRVYDEAVRAAEEKSEETYPRVRRFGLQAMHVVFYAIMLLGELCVAKMGNRVGEIMDK
ncbi:hypothetical protein TeGR_g3161, partial [Tetraparma gracilis]